MAKTSVAVKTRDLKTNPNQLRRQNLVPANIFQAKQPSRAIQLTVIDFNRLFKEVGEAGVAYLKLEKEEVPVMVEEVQFDPITDVAQHVSFQAVDLTQKTTAEIPVELVGEFDLPEAVVVPVRDMIEVEALPTDLPEKFVIDISSLTEIGQSITLADLEYDHDKVEIVVGEEGMEAPVVLVQEVEEEPEEEEVIETEIIGEAEEAGEAEAAEGQQPAESAQETEGEASQKEESAEK